MKGRNILTMVFIAVGILNINAQNNEKTSLYLRISPSDNMIKLKSSHYFGKSIKGALFIGDEKNLMSFSAEYGNARSTEFFGIFSSLDRKVIEFTKIGIERVIWHTHSQSKWRSSFQGGLSANFINKTHVKLDCPLLFSSGWGGNNQKQECDRTVDKDRYTLIGLPVSYYLKFEAAKSFGIVFGTHAAIYSNGAHSVGISLGIDIGN